MNKKRAAGVIYLIVGIYGVIFSSTFPMGKWNEPGPGIFPISISILLCISGVFWFIFGNEKEAKARITWREKAPKLGTPSKILFTTTAFVLTLEELGFLFGVLVYLFVLLFWVSRYKLWIALSTATFIGVGSWYFFGKILSVKLPMGPFSLPF
jgi:putative tricarboxylic transport membrane protein